MAIIDPLDLQTLLVNTFAGGVELFMFIAFLAITSLAAKFRMPSIVLFIAFSGFVVMMMSFLLSVIAGVYMLIILLVGVISWGAISNIVR